MVLMLLRLMLRVGLSLLFRLLLVLLLTMMVIFLFLLSLLVILLFVVAASVVVGIVVVAAVFVCRLVVFVAEDNDGATGVVFPAGMFAGVAGVAHVGLPSPAVSPPLCKRA